MNKTLLKMALLTSIITPSVMASADDSRQILALLQQMQTSLTQLHSKVDTLETRLSTLEQEKSSTLPQTQQTLATKPTHQALSSSIAQDTSPDPLEMIDILFKEIQQNYPWALISPDPFLLPENSQKVISLLNEIKEAGTNKAQLRNIRSRMEKGSDLYIDDNVTNELTRFLDVILSPHSELLQKLLSYDRDILNNYLSSNSLRADNLSDLDTAIRNNLISIHNIGLSGEVIPEAENMLIGLMRGGFFNEVKFLYLTSPCLNNLRDCATDMMLQGNLENIHTFNVYCNDLNKAKEIVGKIIAAKKAGKLKNLSRLFFEGPGLDASKSDPGSQELRNGLTQLGIQDTNFASPW